MRSTHFLLALSLCATAMPVFAADPVGIVTVPVVSPERGKDLSVTVWYPAAEGGSDTLVGDNRIFTGAPARRDAPLLRGHFPLVLISHGSGSRAEGMAWIAAQLAEKGFIVAGPDHPGTTSGDSTPIATPRIWERTQDLTNIITAMTTSPKWQLAIDPGKIGVLGFSLGGSTGLELIGARADLPTYADYCDQNTQMMDCQWFAGGFGFVDGKRVASPVVHLRDFDKAHFEQSNFDPRIASAVLVDPGLATSFQADSLRAIRVPTTIINLGSPGGVPVAVYSYKLSAEIPGAHYHQIPGANHFSFLPVCKPGAQDLLSELGDVDPICDGKGLRDRAEVHLDAANLIIEAFEATLK